MKYTGSCHCGNISYAFESEPITNGVRCNCSICIKKGAIMTTFTVLKKAVKIENRNNSLRSYKFGTCKAEHHFCNVCGINTFHQSMVQQDSYRFNIGCLNEVDSTKLEFYIYDGASL